MMSAPYVFQPPAVVTRILGEVGDLNTVPPSYTEEEAAVLVQVTRIDPGGKPEQSPTIYCEP